MEKWFGIEGRLPKKGQRRRIALGKRRTSWRWRTCMLHKWTSSSSVQELSQYKDIIYLELKNIRVSSSSMSRFQYRFAVLVDCLRLSVVYSTHHSVRVFVTLKPHEGYISPELVVGIVLLYHSSWLTLAVAPFHRVTVMTRIPFG